MFWILITSITGKWGFKKLNQLVYGNLKVDDSVLEFASLIKKYYNPRTEIPPVFSNEQLGKILSPVLFIGGDRDCFYNSKKTAERISKDIVYGESIVLENTGHVLINQTGNILSFLKKHDKNESVYRTTTAINQQS